MGSWKPKPSRFDRLARAQQSMIRGTVGGRVAQSASTRVRRTMKDTKTSRQAMFSWTADPAEESPPFPVKARGHIQAVLAAGDGQYTANVMVNGDVVLTIDRDSDRIQYKRGLDIKVKQYDKITVELTDTDGGSGSLTCELIELN